MATKITTIPVHSFVVPPFVEGNIIKYLTRYKHSGTRLDDLKKARHYLDMLIERLEEQ